MGSEVHATATAVGYVRVSTKEQASGVSLDAQVQFIESYCRMRNLTLVAIHRDPGVCGSTALDDRPGGAEVMAAIAGGVRHVVAYKLDRLFRDTIDALTRVRAWDGSGVAMHLVDMGGQTVDTSTAMGRFVLTVLAAAAEMEVGASGSGPPTRCSPRSPGGSGPARFRTGSGLPRRGRPPARVVGPWNRTPTSRPSSGESRPLADGATDPARLPGG
jgi:hypothetical protein